MYFLPVYSLRWYRRAFFRYGRQTRVGLENKLFSS